MKPLADFVCNSKRCRTRQGAPVFELPINATHCPMGHKQIVRLFNRVNVRVGGPKLDDRDMRHTSSSVARRVDQIAEPAMLQAEASASRWKEARLKYPGAKMVATGRMREAIGEVLTGLGSSRVPEIKVDPPERKAVVGGDLGVVEELGSLRGGNVPTKIEARDREFKVVRGGDGTIGMEKV